MFYCHLSMANIYRGIPNLVQLGINDTPLTSALEKGDFKTAEKLIIENQEPSYLDEGPFEKIPLTLVLSNEADFRDHRRHLRLAKLLVEGGANPNLRIPQAEWQGSNPSPMEYLVELYDSVLDLCRGLNSDGCSEDEDGKDYSSDNEICDKTDPLFTIGLHDEENLTPSELREQLLELLDIFLAFGGNPNVRTTISNSTLFHIAVSNPDPDMDLVLRLCEAGGDLNEKNIHGATPLMDLISYAEGDLAMDVIHRIWKIKPDISSLQDQNCSNETALWKAMQSGSPELAIELLQKGASPVPRAFVTIGKWHRPTRLEKIHFSREVALNGVSSIFAALLQDSFPNVLYTSVNSVIKLDKNEYVRPFDVHLLDKVYSCTISPVVDALSEVHCFPDPVLREIMSVVSEETNFKSQSLLSSALRPQDLAHLIFGKLSAGLQQMCVRVIMDTVFISQGAKKSLEFIAHLNGKNIVTEEEMNKKMGDDNSPEIWDDEHDDKDIGSPENVNKVEEIQNLEEVDSEVMEVEEIGKTVNNTDYIVVQDLNNITHWNVIMELDRTVIQRLVEEYLKLPSSLVSRFIIEAIRLQLGASLYVFESTDCIQGCDEESDGSSELFDDDASEDGEESGWSAGFMSSDEYDDEYMDSDMQWESGEEEEEEDEDDIVEDSSGSKDVDCNDGTVSTLEDDMDETVK